MKPSFIIFSILLIVLCRREALVDGQTPVPCPNCPLFASDAQVLSDLQATFPDLGNSSISNWTGSPIDACRLGWPGVWCSGSSPFQRITNLYIRSATGYFPFSIVNLDALKALGVQADFIQPIPSFLQNLALEQLYLLGNPWLIDTRYFRTTLQPFPTFLGSLVNLTVLSLNGFNFSGSADSLASLTRLRDLSLSQCALSGPFPNIAPLSKLYNIDLSDNSFDGPIPSYINGLGKELFGLDLSHNKFNGPIPEIGGLTSLYRLDLSHNQLVGSLPSSISNLRQLTTLDVANNSLSGQLPSLNNLRSIVLLSLWGNQLEGDVSVSVGKKKNLTWCYMYPSEKLQCPTKYAVCCSGFNQNPTTSVVSSTTSTTIPNCENYECACTSNFQILANTSISCYRSTGGSWIIFSSSTNNNGSSLNNQTLIIGAVDKAIIGGGFEQTQDASMVVYATPDYAGSMLVGGPARLNGSLYVALIDAPVTSNISFYLINASEIHGSFENITLDDDSPCGKAELKVLYTKKAVLLLLTPAPACIPSSRMIQIAAASSLGLFALIIIPVIIVSIFYLRAKQAQKTQPSSMPVLE